VCVCIHLVIGSFSDTVCELADETCNVFSAAELANRTACPVSWKSFQGSSRQLRLQVAWFRACWRKEMWSSWRRMSNVRRVASSARRSTAWKLHSSWRTSSKRRWTRSLWRGLIYELNRTSFTGLTQSQAAFTVKPVRVLVPVWVVPVWVICTSEACTSGASMIICTFIIQSPLKIWWKLWTTLNFLQKFTPVSLVMLYAAVYVKIVLYLYCVLYK